MAKKKEEKEEEELFSDEQLRQIKTIVERTVKEVLKEVRLQEPVLKIYEILVDGKKEKCAVRINNVSHTWTWDDGTVCLYYADGGVASYRCSKKVREQLYKDLVKHQEEGKN